MTVGTKDKNIFTKDDIVIIPIPSTRIKDLTGKHFGRWYVIGYAGNNYKHKSLWWCICECNPNKVYKVVGTALTRGKTKSCGCNITKANKDRAIRPKKAQELKTDEKTLNRILHIFNGMHDRCYNANSKDYMNYGGRNIAICSEWNDDKYSFVIWDLNNGYQNNLTIERINVNEDYSPQNCCWKTFEEQNNNKTTTRYVAYNGVTWRFMDLMRELGFDSKRISNKIRSRIFRYGWDVERAINYEQNESH